MTNLFINLLNFSLKSCFTLYFSFCKESTSYKYIKKFSFQYSAKKVQYPYIILLANRLIVIEIRNCYLRALISNSVLRVHKYRIFSIIRYLNRSRKLKN